MLNIINVKLNFELLIFIKVIINSIDLMKMYMKYFLNCYFFLIIYMYNDRKYNLNIVMFGDILLCFVGVEKK